MKKNIDIEQLPSAFQKIKKSLTKRFPDATTKTDEDGKFYVVDNTGKRILSDVLLYPAQDNVFDAWWVADYVVKVEKIIHGNSVKFSDAKIYKQLIKESGEE